MADDQTTLRSVSWQDIVPGISLVNALRLAFDYRSLVLAALGLVLMTGGWRAIGKAYSNDQELQQWIDDYAAWPWEGSDNLALRASAADAPSLMRPVQLASDNPVVRSWDRLSRPLVDMFFHSGLTWTRSTFLLACGLWALAVWSFFGAAITRQAAVGLATGEHLSWGKLLEFARTKWPSCFAAPLLPMIGVLVAGIPLAIGGLLLRFSVGVVIAGLLGPIALVLGLFMAFLMIGLFFGWPLMFATISVEGRDAFDALSRSYSYTYQKPIRYLLYVVVAALLGTLGWIVAALFRSAVVGLSAWAISWGSGNDQLYRVMYGGGLEGVEGFGARIIAFWLHVVATLAVAFVYSYFWTAMTAIYYLLRLHVDSVEMDEVYLPEEDERFGLPPLKTDAAGVPGTADEPAAGENENGA